MARTATRAPRAARPRARKAPPKAANWLSVADLGELDALRSQLEQAPGPGVPLRWNADPADVQRSVIRLVLTLVDFIRQLLERQAIRRMEAGTLTDQETEDVGRALMVLESTLRDLTVRFDLKREDLNLDLGPLGRMI